MTQNKAFRLEQIEVDILYGVLKGPFPTPNNPGKWPLLPEGCAGALLSREPLNGLCQAAGQFSNISGPPRACGNFDHHMQVIPCIGEIVDFYAMPFTRAMNRIVDFLNRFWEAHDPFICS